MPRVSPGPRESGHRQANAPHAKGDRDKAPAPVGVRIISFPKATNLVELAYIDGELIATFRVARTRNREEGKTRYRYEGVPVETFDLLTHAAERQGHAGAEFAKHVVAKFKGVKMPPEVKDERETPDPE